MQITFIQPEEQLVHYIHQLWIFESNAGISKLDSRIIVPDGRAKIIVPYKQDASAIAQDRVVTIKRHQLALIGVQSSAVSIAASEATTGTIGIELTQKGLYHFFDLNMYEVTNRIISLEDAIGSWAARLQERIGNAKDPRHKISLLQDALIDLLHRNNQEYIFLDRALDIIVQSHGVITIQDLVTQTGYSRRYLDQCFRRHIGLPPKSLANILRFQRMHHLLMQRPSSNLLKKEIHAHYYDQSHFIKEFKRFTGSTPYSYLFTDNKFGRTFDR